MSVSKGSLLSQRMKLLMGSAALVYSFANPVWAQTEDANTETDVEVIESTEASTGDESVQEKVTVTGSRIQRSTFTSISPVQVITTDFSREIGLIDPADVLQDSTAATGQQIDDSFQGFVLDNGPGSSTVSLRGLGAGRTLALINGRRLAPIGVEGAPADPSINLIPSSFVDSYEILLDGASSIYGSDAVAGVANAILRKDYDGFEFGLNGSLPQHGGGEAFNVYGSWGKQMDKGFVAVAVDYERNERMRLSDRAWSAECERLAEVTETGEVRTVDLSTDFDYPGMGGSSCDYFPLGSRIQIAGGALDYGSLYYTPGYTNTGIPNFSESALYGVLYDGDGDGLADFSFYDYTSNGTPADRAADIYGQSQQFSAMVLGDWDIGILGNATAYGEAMYVTQDYEAKSRPGQIFEYVGANNPYNPCNPNGVNGVDCGVAIDNYVYGPAGTNIYNAWVNYYGVPPWVLDQFYGTGITPGAVGPQDVRAIVGIKGDRDNVESTLSQTRLVGGLKGDLPFINYGDMKDWTYDASLTYSRSEGTSKRVGIRGDRLDASLSTSMIDPATGNVVCGVDTTGDGVPDGLLADGTACVPVNFFAPSVLGTPIGDFASQAERDYLFGSREFKTTYEQMVFSAYASGDLFKLPAGTAAGVIGAEFRRDKLNSNPNDVASQGLLWGYFSDRGAKGSMDTKEVYGEIELPLLADQPFATELNLNLSGRFTDTEFAGSAKTYAAKLGWRPVNSLLLRGTYGTSFRAPNVREQFLGGQSGFATLADPCAVPDAAYDAINGYDASQDGRDQTTLDNCIAAGVDPYTFGAGNVTAYSVEVFQTGALNNPLSPETSDSYSYGFVFEQPWTNAFDLTIGATYYHIEVSDAIESQSPSFIIADCYITQPNQTSNFCGNIRRDANGFIDEVDYEYFNVATQVSSGYDVNVLLEKDFALFGRDLDAALDIRANILDEVSYVNGTDVEDYVGEFGFPEKSIQATARFNYDDWRFTWRADWISGVEQDPAFVDPYGSFTSGQGAYTCLGTAYGDENCREIGYAKNYMTHDTSISYSGENWSAVAGIRNVFDRDPPFVSSNEVFTVNGANAPLGVGYDLLGRTFFFGINMEF